MSDPVSETPEQKYRHLDPVFWEQIENELRHMAQRMLRQERPGHTLQTTGLLNETYMKLVVQHNLSNADRVDFLAAAAQTMRRLLIDHARQRAALIRGGPDARKQRVTLSGVELADDGQEVDPLDVDQALNELKKFDERAADVVELKFFGGMSHDDIATRLGVASRTIDNEWAHARSWLRKRLSAYGKVRE